MDAKTAFKTGFAFKLAEAGIAPSDLVTYVDMTTKVAKGKGKEKGESSEDEGRAFSGLGSMAKNLATTGLITGGAASIIAPQTIGTTLGGLTANTLASQMDSVDDLRKRYLIKQYQDLIAQRRARLNNQLVTRALQ